MNYDCPQNMKMNLRKPACIVHLNKFGNHFTDKRKLNNTESLTESIIFWNNTHGINNKTYFEMNLGKKRHAQKSASNPYVTASSV